MYNLQIVGFTSYSNTAVVVGRLDWVSDSSLLHHFTTHTRTKNNYNKTSNSAVSDLHSCTTSRFASASNYFEYTVDHYSYSSNH